jgi:beta-phosphoglucomutase-like phosphatase (HAD superfamily)
MKKIRAVAFDMDGLMLDSEPLYRASWQQVGGQLGFHISDEFYASLLGLTQEDCERALCREFGPGFPAEEFRRRALEVWERVVEASGIPIKRGLVELLDLLDARAVPFAVATSTSHDRARSSLAAAGVSHRVPLLVGGDQVRRGKPAPDLYLAAAAAVGVAPEACLALEDAEAGLEAARAAGMRVVLVPDLKQPSGKAARRALAVVEDLNAVAGLLEIHWEGMVRGAESARGGAE